MSIFNEPSLFELLELIGTIATVIALIYTIKSFRKSIRIQEASFVQNLYESFNRDRQAILDNPRALAILSKERNLEPDEFISKSIGSFDINRAYHLYYLHQQNLIPEKRWRQDIRDLQWLFRDQLVLTQWDKIQMVYPEDFRLFIESQIRGTHSPESR